MIPFGPWHPDRAGINTPVLREALNCRPAVAGTFQPMRTLVAGTAALPGPCRGAVAVLLTDGNVANFCGTADKLWKLGANGVWSDVSSGVYHVGTGEQWKFELYGTLLIATCIHDAMQKFQVAGGTAFAALGGSPPRARYLAIVRGFVVAGAIENNEKRVHWSSNENPEAWVPGTGESDYQDFPNGGPVRGLIGGEVGYVFQADRITRMTYVPGSEVIFQFDEVEGAAGLAAPHSLVRLRTQAFYLAPDGLHRFDLGSGQSTPLGIGKWAEAFMADKRQSHDLIATGAIDPINRVYRLAYGSINSGQPTADRQLIYDWALDEATITDLPTEAMTGWLTQGVTLDTMNSFGTLDTLPFSLDSPFWKGGARGLGIFGTDHKLSYESGPNRAAKFITADGAAARRHLITATRPLIDSGSATVAIATRERQGDPIAFDAAEAMEDTGECPAHASGRVARARIEVPAGAAWSKIEGIETDVRPQGSR